MTVKKAKLRRSTKFNENSIAQNDALDKEDSSESSIELYRPDESLREWDDREGTVEGSRIGYRIFNS